MRYTKPSILLQLIEKDWQPSEITFSAKPYSKIEIQKTLEEVGFTSVNAYNFKGNLAAPKEDKYVCFVARKTNHSFRSLENTTQELSASNKTR